MRIEPLDLHTLRNAVATCAFGFASLAVVPAALADAPVIEELNTVEEIVVITEDDAGEAVETTIWLVMVDGNAYIRTSGRSGWGANVKRNPAITVRVETTDFPVRVTFVEDASERDRVTARFREKYGFQDAMIGIVRGSNPPIMRLDTRPRVAS
jgi:hypothetical protein